MVAAEGAFGVFVDCLESGLPNFLRVAKTDGVMDDAPQLPNDLLECQQLLLAAFKTNSELERVLDQTAASYEQLQEAHQSTIDQLAQLKRWAYGQRRERIVEGVGQLHLFDLELPTAEAPPSEPAQKVAAHARRQRRELDLGKLPHFRHELDVSPAEKTCSCCGRDKDCIGTDESKLLDYVPAKLEVHVYARPKYACRHCKDGVVSPPLPEKPIARSIAGPGLIAQIVVSKFGDHLPLYRQEDIFTRHGLHIARSTLCDWVKAAAELLRPLYERQKELVLQSSVLWTDDTPVTVLSGKDRSDGKNSFKGRFWPYISEQHPYSVYDYTESRARDGPAKFLAGFQGYLHADAYAGYDHIFTGSNDSILEVACWAHARRKFFDAIPSSPRESHQMVDWIGQLYDIEDQARTLSNEARQALRQQEANPILDRIEQSLDELKNHRLRKSALSKAVWYALNQWQALRRYTEDGRLSIDNNKSERTVRHQAIGRKNWLFLGSSQAGPRAAVLFTILAGAKRHRIEPWAYLRDLLINLDGEDQDLDEWLPDRWAAKHPASILTHRLEESREKASKQSERRGMRRSERKPK
jgi:transposase